MNQKLQKNSICIGKIVNTHGIRGDIKIKMEPSNFEFNFKKQKEIYYLNKNNEFTKIEISNIRNFKNMYLVKPNTYNDINDVLFLKNEYIYLLDKDLGKGNVFLNEVIDYKVYLNNDLIGTVSDYFIQGIFYSLVVDKESSDDGDTELIIPVKDIFIKEIIKEEGIINVIFPDGYI